MHDFDYTASLTHQSWPVLSDLYCWLNCSHEVRHAGGGDAAEGGEQGGDGEAGGSDVFGQSFTAKNNPAVQGDEM